MTGPKVIHVTTTDMSLELLLGPQLQAFRRQGYEVIGASAPGPYVAGLEAAGIRHIPLDHATRAMEPLEDARSFLELVRVFRRERPAIVHTHNPKPGWFGRPAARIARVPHVVNTVHGLYATADDPWPKRAVVHTLERVASVASQAELIQNEEDLATLRRLRIPDAKLHLLGNGVDLARFDARALPAGTREAVRAEFGVADHEVLVGAVGRLVWEKGLAELFEAARHLRAVAPQARVVVVGPLDDAKADALRPHDLAEISEELGILFPGERRDIEAVYAALDLYVLASHREGFPRSAMEAAAMGLPVVATDIRGCRQVVDDGVTGRLIPVHDGKALGAALAELVVDHARRGEMAAAARLRAEAEFDQQRCIDLTLATYDRLLSS